MSVLILTRSDDNESVELVTRALERRGATAVRLNTDLFPTEVRLTLAQDGEARRATLDVGQGPHDLAEVTSIWLRRHKIGGALPDGMDRQLRAGAVTESTATLFGVLAGLDAFWMDPLPVIRHSGHKPLQLRLARQLGMDTPRTLITNDSHAVRRFVASCPQGLVAKMLSSFRVLEGGVEKVVFTTPVTDASLEHLDALRWSPMTFQERLPKQFELRVTIVGRRVFAASIDSQAMERARDDWRREGLNLAESWKRYAIPAELERQVLALMNALRLNYGAADFIVTPEGRHVFLEINPAGEFFWLERCPGLPISEAIAEVLAGGAARRQS